MDYYSIDRENQRKELDDLMRRNIKLNGTPPKIIEGDGQNVKVVPLTRYWENSGQISHPADDSRVQEFLKVEDKPLTLKKIMRLVFGISVAILICCCILAK